MNVKIANKLYDLRKKSGLSQEELADKIGVSRQAVSKWERAEASPDTDNLIMLSKIYGVTLDDIISEEDIIEANKEDQKDYSYEEYDYDDDDDEKYENSKDPKIVRQRAIVGGITGALFLLATIAFLLVGFLTGIWHPTWALFLIPIVIESIIKAVLRKSPVKFAYPVLVVIIFIVFGSIYGIWHPLWVIFITIPVFYSIANLFKIPKSKWFYLE